MNLEEFVTKVLVDLDHAVEKARGQMNRDVYFSSNQSTRTIEFDIAVSAEESDEKSGKAGVRVLQFAEGGGQLSKSNKNSTVSRIQFGLHISQDTKREQQEYSAIDM